MPPSESSAGRISGLEEICRFCRFADDPLSWKVAAKEAGILFSLTAHGGCVFCKFLSQQRLWREVTTVQSGGFTCAPPRAVDEYQTTRAARGAWHFNTPPRAADAYRLLMGDESS